MTDCTGPVQTDQCQPTQKVNARLRLLQEEGIKRIELKKNLTNGRNWNLRDTDNVCESRGLGIEWEKQICPGKSSISNKAMPDLKFIPSSSRCVIFSRLFKLSEC